MYDYSLAEDPSVVKCLLLTEFAYAGNMRERNELVKILQDEVLDIWQVADLANMSRSSVHTYLGRPSSSFPKPVYESEATDASGAQTRHPTRLWSRAEVELWVGSRGTRGNRTAS